MRRLPVLISLLVAVLLPLAVAPAASAKRPLVGIGDQNFHMFDDARFQKLGLDVTRIAVPWDWYRNPSYITFLDQWVAATQRANVKPLIAMNRNWRNGGERYRPPIGVYRKSFRLLRHRYPQITDFSAWNEANHSTQPTWNSPKQAARYYKAMLAECPRACRIVAADVLDARDMPAWLAKFKRYAPKARLWGLHSYKDANDGTTWRIKAMLKAVKGEVWLTETGGIKRLKPAPGSRGDGRKNTLKGQALAVKRTFALAKLSKRITRIYFYQWREDPKQRWDSAFTDRHGKSRPALATLRAEMRRLAPKPYSPPRR
jgi:hypothetical protein